MRRRSIDLLRPKEYAVWLTFDGQCFWCGEPLVYGQSTVDHVIPEVFAEPRRAGELETIRKLYGLGPEFGINDYTNWVPAHANCNSRKSSDLFTASPAMIFVLDGVQRHAPRAREVATRTIADRRKGAILGRLEAALHSGAITRQEIDALLEGLPVAPSGDPRAGRERTLRFTDRWSVVEKNGAIEYVTDGSRAGFRPGPDGPEPHPSFRCGHCGSYGPWNGIVCLTCGNRDDPD